MATKKGKRVRGPRGLGRDLGKVKGVSPERRIVRYDDGVTYHELASDVKPETSSRSK